jgi:hypothetical protein
MFIATGGYTDKGNESEHVHEHWWERDTIGCPSPRHEEECCKWSYDSAWLHCSRCRSLVESSFLPNQALVSRTLKRAYSASRRIKEMCSRGVWLNDQQWSYGSWFCLRIHQLATMPMVQQLVSHNTQGRLNEQNYYFRRCVTVFFHLCISMVTGHRCGIQRLGCGEFGSPPFNTLEGLRTMNCVLIQG